MCFEWLCEKEKTSEIIYKCQYCKYETRKILNLEYHIKYYHEMDEETGLLNKN